MVGGHILDHRVAAGAPPGTIGLVRIPFLLILGDLGLVPCLNTLEVSDGVAFPARVDLGVPKNILCADDTLVIARADVLVYACPQVGCS